MVRLPKDWIQTYKEAPYLKVKWGAIITGLIGAPLAALGISFASAPASLTGAIEQLVDAAGEGVSALVGAVTGSLSWLLGRSSAETAAALPDGLIGFIGAIAVGALTLFGLSVVVTFALGGGG